MATAAAPRSRYIPWLFVAGFAVVIAVNAIMISFAIGSFSGLYTPHPRDLGQQYNGVAADQAERDALGWRIDATWRPEAGRLEIAVVDAAGQPLSGARVFVDLVRPVENRAPLGISLEAIDTGRYAGTVALPARGNWDLDIVIERGSERFAQTRRIFLK
jgi:nitrogen fixation protein FixH